MSRLQDRLARCSNSFYPGLVTNFPSWADPVRQENPRQTRGPPTSGEYINFFNSVKYIQIIFSGILCSPSCGFHVTLWKSPRLLHRLALTTRSRSSNAMSLSFNRVIAQIYPLLCLKYSTWRSRLAASSRVFFGPPRFLPFSDVTLYPPFTFLIMFLSVESTQLFDETCSRINAVIPVVGARLLCTKPRVS